MSFLSVGEDCGPRQASNQSRSSSRQQVKKSSDTKPQRTVKCTETREAVINIRHRRRLDSKRKAYKRSRRRGAVAWRRRRGAYNSSACDKEGGGGASELLADRVIRNFRGDFPLAARLGQLVSAIIARRGVPIEANALGAC